MIDIPGKSNPAKLPSSVILEKPPFIPRMVLTQELQAVARDVLHQWRNRKAFEPLKKYGIRPLDRLLFWGPPGNGKTMACYWMAKELDIPVYRVLCNNLHSPYVAEMTRNVAEVMDFFSNRRDPALCLWDEVDAIFVNRKTARGSRDGEVASALTVFMQTLDRWQSPTLMVMATNLPEQIDDALLSRIELQIKFPGPTDDQCEALIQYWRELLCDHGSDEWGPTILETIRNKPASSFRELQQMIAYAAREWTAKNCKS